MTTFRVRFWDVAEAVSVSAATWEAAWRAAMAMAAERRVALMAVSEVAS